MDQSEAAVRAEMTTTMAELKGDGSSSPPPMSSAEALPSVTTVVEEGFVPLAALEAVDVNRLAEANHGMLKEPAPPSRTAVRVTKDGEGAPSIPTELLQLLAG